MIKKLALLVLVLAQSSAWAATCKISEYRSLATDAQGREVPVALEPPITTQTVTYTTSAQSSALDDQTRFIRVICDAKAHFVISAAGTNATDNSPFISSGVAEYFGVQAGTSMIVDFYDGSS